MKLEQYDHKGLLELFRNDSSDSFEIIDVIISEAIKLPVGKIDLQKVYGLADSEVGNAPKTGIASEEVIQEFEYDM